MHRPLPSVPLAVALLAAAALLTGCGMVASLTGEDVNQTLRTTGLPAEATVLEIWDTGVSVNDDPVVGFRLEVRAPERAPWTAEARQLVSQLAIPRIQPGAVLAVRYDPADPSRVAIMTAGEEPPPPVPPPPPAPPDLGPDLSVEPLADRIWLVTAWDEVEGWGRVPANSLVVAGEREVALVDTPWNDAQTELLLAWVAAHLRLPVTTVIPTHFHVDCLGGLAAAHAAGARSYALERTAELARAAGNPVPENLFTGRLRLELGGRVLEIDHPGAGHTVDAVVVFVPDAAVLFAGDLARSAGSTTLGNTADAELAAWPATIAAIEAAYPDARVVVPGHGAPGGRELLAHTRELLVAQEQVP